MRKKLWIVVLIALVAPVCVAGVQEGKKEQKRVKPESTGIFRIEHADVNGVCQALQVFNVIHLQCSEPAGVISVAGSRETVAAIGEAIRKLDVAPPAARNIELTFYMLAASKEAATGSGLPDTLAGVAKQLKRTFAYSGIELLETSVMRVRDGGLAETRGAISGENETPVSATSYLLSVKRVQVVSDGEGSRIRIDRLQLALRVPFHTKEGGFEFRDAGFNTNIDIREGQKAVVGKANVDGGNRDFILAVTGKVLE